MLLDVTALLASAHTNPVAEAFSVPARPQSVVVGAAVLSDDQRAFQTVLDRVASAAGGAPAGASGTGIDARPAAAISPIEKVPASRISALRGMELLQQLPLLSRSELSTFSSRHADVLESLVANPPAAASVSAFWTGLSGAEQKKLITEAPTAVGNLEGVPYVSRDQANRRILDATEKAIARQRASTGRAAGDALSRRLHMLQQVRASLGGATSGHELVELTTDGSGTAVVVSGDVTTADYVTYLVPGMYSSVDTQMTTWVQGGQRIQRQQQAWLDALAAPGAPHRTAAVVTWFGYHAPNASDIASLGPAREAEQALGASLDGLRALRSGDEPYVSIIAHSYGSTAAMMALQDGTASADALVVVGSPGAPVQTAGDLAVRDGNVWVGAADLDPIASTALYGPSPAADAFGAHAFGVGGAVDPITGARLAASHLHTDYFADGTESLRNMELITIGRGDLVIGG